MYGQQAAVTTGQELSAPGNISMSVSVGQIRFIIAPQEKARIISGVQQPFIYYLTTLAMPSSYGTVTGAGQYSGNTYAHIEAIPEECCRFVRWSDGETDNPRDVLMQSDTVITAIFEKIPYLLTVDVDDPAHGTPVITKL